MKQYEVIREIINQCPLNHSRDQFFEEIQCEDPEKLYPGNDAEAGKKLTKKAFRKMAV